MFGAPGGTVGAPRHHSCFVTLKPKMLTLANIVCQSNVKLTKIGSPPPGWGDGINDIPYHTNTMTIPFISKTNNNITQINLLFLNAVYIIETILSARGPQFYRALLFYVHRERIKKPEHHRKRCNSRWLTFGSELRKVS